MYQHSKNTTLRSGIATLLIAGFCSLNLQAASEQPGNKKETPAKTQDTYSKAEMAQIATAALRGPAVLASIYHEKKGNVKTAAATALLVDALRISNSILALHNATTNNQGYNLAWLSYDTYALSANLVNLVTAFSESKEPKRDKELHKNVDKLLISIKYILLPLAETATATFSALATDKPEQQTKADVLTSFIRMTSLYLTSKPSSLEAKLKLALLGLNAWAVWKEFQEPTAIDKEKDKNDKEQDKEKKPSSDSNSDSDSDTNEELSELDESDSLNEFSFQKKTTTTDIKRSGSAENNNSLSDTNNSTDSDSDDMPPLLDPENSSSRDNSSDHSLPSEDDIEDYEEPVASPKTFCGGIATSNNKNQDHAEQLLLTFIEKSSNFMDDIILDDFEESIFGKDSDTASSSTIKTLSKPTQQSLPLIKPQTERKDTLEDRLGQRYLHKARRALEQELAKQEHLLASLEQKQAKKQQPLLLTFVEQQNGESTRNSKIDDFDFDFSGGFEDSDFDNSHANDQNDNNIARLVFGQHQESLTFEDRLARRYQKEGQRTPEQTQRQNSKENTEQNNRVPATQQPETTAKDRRNMRAGKRTIVRAKKAANKPQPRRSARANKGVRPDYHGDKLYEAELKQRGL
ncbi:hypothetical protein K2W90_00040 [Candidatus Babeliales bacterium]|nr:hypothetical protein [Candidatus Babeliales bacterium]